MTKNQSKQVAGEESQAPSKQNESDNLIRGWRKLKEIQKESVYWVCIHDLSNFAESLGFVRKFV